MKIAIPLANGKLTAHFGHCQEFAFVEVVGNQIKKTEKYVPPPHEPGVLPNWLQYMGNSKSIQTGTKI
jgi:predicted Fe-Mo cluster-binding NifX family protein